jgi:hypothetical protein
MSRSKYNCLEEEEEEEEELTPWQQAYLRNEREIFYPANAIPSEAARDLLSRLLHRDPAQRIKVVVAFFPLRHSSACSPSHRLTT